MEKKKRFRRKIILFVIIFIISALLIFASSIKEPSVSVVGIEIVKIDFSKIEITFLICLKVDNKNLVDITVQNVQAKIYTDGDYIGHAEKKEKVTIRANSAQTISVIFIMQRVPAKIPVKEIRAIGSAHVNILFWEDEVNFDETRTL